MIREVASGGQILANLSVTEATEYTNFFRAAALLAEYHCKDISDFPARHYICNDIYLFDNLNEGLDLLLLLHLLKVIKFSFNIPPGDPNFCMNIASCATKTVRKNKEISEDYLKSG